MPHVTTKQTFGRATGPHTSPPASETIRQAMNLHLSFKEALKLYFGLGQLLGRLNGYDRRTRAGGRAAANSVH